MINHLDSLSIRQKIGQLFFIGVPGPAVDNETRALVDEVSPGGICLFARNIREARQTRDLLDAIAAQLPITPLLSIDQEGGLVDRLRRVITPMPAAAKIKTAADAAELAEIIAETLRTLGFNMDFAPVVDVIDDARSGPSNGLVSRTFGTSKETVAELAGEFLSVLQANGVTGCLKHFPGLGASRVDSHEELPSVDIEESELREIDLFPYRTLLATGDVRSVMVAHASFPGVGLQETDQSGKLLPSSLSIQFVTNLLRGELAYDGLVITDDLEMGAIVNNYGIDDACTMAIGAGSDMLAICADPVAIREGYHAVVKAVEDGHIAMERVDASLGRIARAKEQLSAPLPFDRARLELLSDKVADLGRRLNS